MIHKRHIYPSLVLVQPRKTRPCLTEKLLTGRKESNQTNQTKEVPPWNGQYKYFTGGRKPVSRRQPRP